MRRTSWNELQHLFSFKRYPPWVHNDTIMNSKPALMCIQLSHLFYLTMSNSIDCLNCSASHLAATVDLLRITLILSTPSLILSYLEGPYDTTRGNISISKLCKQASQVFSEISLFSQSSLGKLLFFLAVMTVKLR